MKPIVREDVSALILAGGEGRRMGGLDKGWIDFEGTPLIVRALATARSVCTATLISANRNRERYAQLGMPVVPDLSPGFQGPIAGILSGAISSSRSWLWILPVDCPRLDPQLLELLKSSASRSGSSIAVANDGIRDQPLFMLLNRAAQARLLNYYLAGGRSIRGWLQTQIYVRTDCRLYTASFLNVNEPSQFPPGDKAGPSRELRSGVGTAA